MILPRLQLALAALGLLVLASAGAWWHGYATGRDLEAAACRAAAAAEARRLAEAAAESARLQAQAAEDLAARNLERDRAREEIVHAAPVDPPRECLDAGRVRRLDRLR
jgi:alpha-D-ribose 1-methylphosphonate 5-triphosphate synthase subunit PhnG